MSLGQFVISTSPWFHTSATVGVVCVWAALRRCSRSQPPSWKGHTAACLYCDHDVAEMASVRRGGSFAEAPADAERFSDTLEPALGEGGHHPIVWWHEFGGDISV